MNYFKYLTISILLTCSILSATEFTISTYNCGGLSDHYDYLRAVAMQKLMQERHIAEPEQMALNEKIQKVALKILFSIDPQEQAAAQQEWDQKGYQQLFATLTAAPSAPNSPNKSWNQKIDAIITSYKIRPVVIHDEEVKQLLTAHLKDLTGKEGDMQELLQEARAVMAERIFNHQLKYDIICLQEADYLNAAMFHDHYEVILAETSHSKNGVAWNKNRFELVETLGNILGRAFAVKLLDKESGKTVLVASGHITGCNPYRIEIDPSTGASDSAKGDGELQAVMQLFEQNGADFMLIGMDSNVTSLHPRLNILKEAGYRLDYENFIEPTCASPNQILNTRIDWIALKTPSTEASVTNIPVLGVGLNSLQTNISDHKPVAAKIAY